MNVVHEIHPRRVNDLLNFDKKQNLKREGTLLLKTLVIMVYLLTY